MVSSLYRVRAGCHLLWPLEWDENYRGGEGTLVDTAAPLEDVWLGGQMHKLEPVPADAIAAAEEAGQPIAPAPTNHPAALAELARWYEARNEPMPQIPRREPIEVVSRNVAEQVARVDARGADGVAVDDCSDFSSIPEPELAPPPALAFTPDPEPEQPVHTGKRKR